MKNKMQEKLSHILAEVKAFSETYKQEIADVPKTGDTSCENDIETAIYALIGALYEINEAEGKEAESQPTSAEYKDYQRENNATSGKE